MEFKCPQCQSLVYSRKTKVCGHCNAVLPWVETEVETSQLWEERRWARDLADRFDSPELDRARSRKDLALHETDPGQQTPNLSAEELLERFQYAQTFKAFFRPVYWVYAAGWGFQLALFAFMYCLVRGFIPGLKITDPFLLTQVILVWCVVHVVLALVFWIIWRRLYPNCPKCRQNIQRCHPNTCHVCGGPLTDQRCARCQVDYNWTGWLRLGAGGRGKCITYCPACGVYLDTKLPRSPDGPSWL